jgi:hypothetical protein
VTEIAVVTIETVTEGSHQGERGPLGKKVLVVHICAKVEGSRTTHLLGKTYIDS